MSYLFKKGDVVRYKKSEIYCMPYNGHGVPDATKEFVVSGHEYDPFDDELHQNGMVRLEGYENRCFAFRLELVKEAPKKKKPKHEGNFAWGVFNYDGSLCQAFKTRLAARDFNKFGCYQIKKIKYEIV